MTSPRSLLAISALGVPELLTLLERAAFWHAQSEITPVLAGKTVQLLFFENSTRTRTSFEQAALRLGATVINVPFAHSSLAKGETLYDTLATLDALHPHAIVVRHHDSGMAAWLASFSQAAVLNAGDGQHEHPTQALLDAFTLQQHLGALAGKTIAIVGDIRHSRVARSNILLLTALGAQVRVIAPPMLLPDAVERYGVRVHFSLAEGLQDCDAVMLLRLQTERMASRFLPSLAEYAAFWQVNHHTLQVAKPGAVVLHPGPINREVEISSALADDPERCLLLQQVANGVPVRMACLEWALCA